RHRHDEIRPEEGELHQHHLEIIEREKALEVRNQDVVEYRHQAPHQEHGIDHDQRGTGTGVATRHGAATLVKNDGWAESMSIPRGASAIRAVGGKHGDADDATLPDPRLPTNHSPTRVITLPANRDQEKPATAWARTRRLLLGPSPEETRMNLTHVGRAAHRSSRPWIGLPGGLALLLLGIAGSTQAASAATWVETWGQAMVSHVQPSPGHEGVYAAPHLRDATVRQTVLVSVGGQRLRVRLANVYGSAPLTITAASVAPAVDVAGDHTAIDPAHSHALRFGGKPTLTIPAGATALSDPVALAVPALSNL